MNSFLFSGYARLPQDVSQKGRIIHCSCTLIMDLARDFLNRLLAGHSVITERDVIERELRYRYRGHSQSALIFALRKVFEAVDQSPLVLGDAADEAEGHEAGSRSRGEKALRPTV
jgi:Domain of unknown function (DUF3870)